MKMRPEIKLSKTEKSEWVKIYETTNKLPSMHVPCTLCDMAVVMIFGNLHNRVQKFGSIENLLNTFKCKECARAMTVKKVKVTKRIKKEKVQVDVSVLEPIKFVYNPGPVITFDVLAANAELCKEYTNEQCFNVQNRLNRGGCGDCVLFKNCGVSSKKVKGIKVKSNKKVFTELTVD